MKYNKFALKSSVKTLFLMALISATTGCSSMLTIGNSETDGCKGVPESSGKCLSAMEVYQLTSDGQPLIKMKQPDAEELNAKNDSFGDTSLIPVEEKKAVEEVKVLPKKQNQAVSIITGNNPVPVRMPSKVMRVWVNSYESTSGDFVAPGYIFTEIEPKKWTMGNRITSDGSKQNPLKSEKEFRKQ